MSEERQPIGYLMGLPIYETLNLLDTEPEAIALLGMTKERAKRCMEVIAAEAIAKSLLTQRDEVQC